MEDRLEEAIHVMRSHAVGQATALASGHGDMNSLLTAAASAHNGGVGGLAQAFSGAGLPLSNRHASMVRGRLELGTGANARTHFGNVC